MKASLFLLLLFSIHVAFGQAPASGPGPAKADYLKKAKTQKKLAWILGGTGLGLFTAGLIMYMSEFGNGLSGGTNNNDKTSQTGETLIYAGGGLILISVPLELASKRNQRIAASLAVEGRRILNPQQGAIASCFLPVLSFKVDLGRR